MIARYFGRQSFGVPSTGEITWLELDLSFVK